MQQIDASKVQWDATPPTIDPSLVRWDSAPSEIPAPRRAASPMAALGRTAASLADVTIGGLIPGAIQYGAYPILRAFSTPEQATAATRRMVEQVDQPFGKAFGVSGTPEYEQEASRQLMNFIGENFQKGAKWIAETTGLPQGDVESVLATSTFAAPKVGAAVSKVAAPAVQQARMGAELIAEPMLQKRRARLSEESYAKGPQLDAAKEAQRLGIALNPSDIQPSATSRLLTAAAGERGQQAITDVNKVRVREVALKELGLPTTTPLNSGKAFDQARAQVAKPYEDVSKLPTMTADDQLVARLESFRVDPNVIGSKEYAPSIDKIVDDAIAKTQSGLTGAQLLKSVQVLRERARKTYNNRSATIEATDIADTNLAVANALESMVESNIFNPRLLSEFREARQKMARAYAYEGATDFNTGVVDVGKLSRITAKDSMLTGDIATLGRVAGNFPDAFTTSVASPLKTLTAIGRTGVAGTLGGVAGYLAGQDYLSAALGSIAGAGAGKVAESIAANRLVSPGYQAGLKVPDYRIPVNQLAVATAPIPQNRAVVPFDPRNAVVQPTDIVGYTTDGSPITAAQAFSQPNFTMPRPNAPVSGGMSSPITTQRALPAPSAESTMAALRAEDARAAAMTDAAIKAREMAKGFEEIAAKAKNAQAKRDALAQRERMMDYAEQLEDQLRAIKQPRSGAQGPKTRAAQRNQLRPASSENKLIVD